MVRNLLTLATTLAEKRLARHGRRAIGKIAVAAVGLGFAGLCILGAFVCGLWALFVYVRPIVGPVGAPLIVAATLLLFAALSLVLLRISTRRRRFIPTDHSLANRTLSEEVHTLFKDQKTTLLLSALMAGVVAGSSRK